jgi:hypothetical protein
LTLHDVLREAAASLPDIDEAMAPDGSRVWSRAGQAFTTLSPDGMTGEFRLDPAVAAAAARTPDVDPSPRGPGWVRFRPGVLDDHGVDRAVAWFVSAHRRLATG